jgi:mannose/cellobiose epimerase-like protein (N-acyl-D-glucosamine 2-epimerase family)/anti-anti-sigma regulatory factor
MEKMHFTYSDTIAGYVTSSDEGNKTFNLQATDGREFQVKITATTIGEIMRNLGENFLDPAAPLESMIKPGRYLFAYGIFYPEHGNHTFEAKRIILVGRAENEYRFETPDWWIRQIRQLARFYFNAQFPDGNIDYRNYRTQITLEGQKVPSTRQETDTISRMIYGFATAYLLTGEDRYLTAAERGTQYLREHMRAVLEDKDVVYWYHGIDIQGTQERKIFASAFGDDYDAIPAYEQIYALAGPVQTYRITGDPAILSDAEKTVNLFDKYFLDREKGGYFSHIGPISLDPHDESLPERNRARKNWNSNGDHAPAYMINLWLATHNERYANFLVNTANIIEQHFPDYEHSPFVQERFYEDWSHDKTWGWQQNRAVVGHNLKIAWNLMRIHHLHPDERYTNLAKQIAKIMPTVGIDLQRGGIYDTMEREKIAGEEWYRFVWHDRKAWWQQEQLILAYLILHGSLRAPEYLRIARESVAFYNTFFPDHDSGGVYFNVLASGTPYLVGNERLKGSHSMSGYHSFELCYLAAVYSNLLINKQPMDFYFKPQQGALKDNILYVQPDILPPGSVRLEAVWVNGSPYNDFDAEAMTVKLPERHLEPQLVQRPSWVGTPYRAPSAKQWQVRVRLIPTGLLFDPMLDLTADIAELTLFGDLNDTAVPAFRMQLDKIVEAQPQRVILRLENLHTMCEQAGRALSFISDKLTSQENIYTVGANNDVQKTFEKVGLKGELVMMDTYDPSKMGTATPHV